MLSNLINFLHNKEINIYYFNNNFKITENRKINTLDKINIYLFEDGNNYNYYGNQIKILNVSLDKFYKILNLFINNNINIITININLINLIYKDNLDYILNNNIHSINNLDINFLKNIFKIKSIIDNNIIDKITYKKYNKLWAHLHCINLEEFNENFKDHIDIIIKYFNLIITYNYGNVKNIQYIYINKINKTDENIDYSINFLKNNNIKFDMILYLNSLNIYKKHNEYNNCNIYDKFRNDIKNLLNNFNWKIYKPYNENIGMYKFGKINRLYEKNYNYGITYDKNNLNNYKQIIPNFINNFYHKIGLIYVYYERKNELKNQTNLAYFIKYGILSNIKILIILNSKCSVEIPINENIYILNNNSYYDFDSYKTGLKYFENIFNDNIYNIFEYIFFANCSAIGPIYDNNQEWFLPFINKLENTNSYACSTIGNISDEYYNNFYINSYFFLIKCNSFIIDRLLNFNLKIYSKSEDITYENTCFGNKKNKNDCIITGEYGLSICLDFNVCSLLENKLYLNKRFDYHWNENEIKKTIFIKNVNRINSYVPTILGGKLQSNNILKRNFITYNCKSILYDYCIDFINLKLNNTNIFKNIQYNLFPEEDKNINLFIDYKNGNKEYTDYLNNNVEILIEEKDQQNIISPLWTSRNEGYNNFYKSEEKILFPYLKKNNKSCAIYSHYNEQGIITFEIINCLKTLIILGYDIIFYTSCEKIYNIDINILPFKINYFNINKGAGTDLLMWLDGLKNINDNYDWILLLNDSLIFPIHGIENMEKSIMEIRKSSDFWGHWDSYDVQYHIMSPIMEFKMFLKNDIINFIDSKVHSCKEKLDFILNIEVKIATHIKSLNYITKSIISMEEDNIKYEERICSTQDPRNLPLWIKNKKSFCFKAKYSISYLNYFISKEFNYLTKNLIKGVNGYISDGEKYNCWPKPDSIYIKDIDNFLDEIIIKNKFNGKKLALIMSYSKTSKICNNVILLSYIYNYYGYDVFIISNIDYNINNNKIQSLTYKTNIGMDFGILIRFVNSYLKNNYKNLESLIVSNDSCFVINKFDTFFNWYDTKKNDNIYGLFENKNMDWGNEHLMSMFIIYKGKCIQKLVEFISNFNYLTLFNKLICSKDKYDYYKFYLLKNNKESIMLKNEPFDTSNERWYYLYIILVYEMGISNYFKNLNYKYESFFTSDDLKIKYEFIGIPLIEQKNIKNILKISPICKFKFLNENLIHEYTDKNKKIINFYKN